VHRGAAALRGGRRPAGLRILNELRSYGIHRAVYRLETELGGVNDGTDSSADTHERTTRTPHGASSLLTLKELVKSYVALVADVTTAAAWWEAPAIGSVPRTGPRGAARRIAAHPRN